LKCLILLVMRQGSNRKRKLGSYPFLSVVFSITLSLFVLGLFGLLLILTGNLTNSIQENVEIQVYLNKPISDSEVSRIQRIIGSKPYILQTGKLEPITRITKEQAAQEFLQNTGEDFSEFLGDNPLRDVLMVRIAPAYQPTDSLSKVVAEIEGIRGVYEVNYVASLIEKINKNLAKVGGILMGFAVLFLVMVVILINNTIKLALYSQRFLIRSMQLVGATGSFIRQPFLNRALVYGMISGLIAALILFGLGNYIKVLITDIASLYNLQHITILYVSLILIGILVAYLSTYRAIRKYLKISLDELY
jgi:cell division transport system permease protein